MSELLKERFFHYLALVIPKNDTFNILLLLFLYILQGVPLGLASAMPLLIQGDSMTASYEYQATFSWVFWPFSLKLIWAPLVDSIYLRRFGRRKSWLIPVQYLIGLWMIVLSYTIDDWFGRPPDNPWGVIGSHGPLKIHLVTFGFFVLTFLASTQDIVVDGWALTMLSKKNVAWASTCNTVGQVTGHIIAFLLFLSLESAETANKYLRSKVIPNRGIVSTNGFLYFWGIVFIISTTFVALLKKESSQRNENTGVSKIRVGEEVDKKKRNKLVQQVTPPPGTEENLAYFEDKKYPPQEIPSYGEEIEILPENDKSSNRNDCDGDPELSLYETYRIMKGVLFLKPIMIYIAMQFLVKLPFSPGENIFALKAIEYGVSKDKLVFLGVLLLPLQTTLPFLITKWTTGPNPMSIFLASVLPRIIFGSLTIPIIMLITNFRETNYDHSRILNIPLQPANISDAGDLSILNQWQGNHHFFSSHEKSLTYTYSYSFYIMILVQYILYTIFQNSMFVSQMAFHAKISDPQIGGTYMTLLNTATNLAANLPSTIMLYMVDPLTWRSCREPNVFRAGLASVGIRVTQEELAKQTFKDSTLEFLTKAGQEFIKNSTDCRPMNGIETCEAAGGTCQTIMDGFFFEVSFCVILGVIAYFAFVRKSLKYLDSLPVTSFYYRPPVSPDHTSKRRKRLSSAD